MDKCEDNFSRNGLIKNTNYHCKILTNQYAEQVIDVFTRAFCHDEPMTNYLHMDETKYREFAREVTNKAIEDELSIVALDEDKVIALALVEDLADPGSIPDFDPKFNDILALLDTLGGDFFKEKNFPSKHVAHLFITAVDENYRSEKLSTLVNFSVMDIAAQKGFDFMYCEFTNFLNEKGTVPHLKNKKRLIGSQSYSNFSVNGNKPFEHLNSGANAYLWEIRRQLLLRYKKNGVWHKEAL